jgi:hypothetical protein
LKEIAYHMTLLNVDYKNSLLGVGWHASKNDICWWLRALKGEVMAAWEFPSTKEKGRLL